MSFDSKHPPSSPDSGEVYDVTLALAEAQTLLQRSSTARLDQDISTALEVIGRAHDADRAYLFQIKDMMFVENTHEWVAPGIKPVQADLRETPYYIGEMFWTAFRREGVLRLSDIASVPAGSDVHRLLVQQEVKSLIAAPLKSAGDLVGFVGLDYCRKQKRFEARDGAVMRSLAASMGAALEIRRLGKQRDLLAADLQTAQEKISAMVKALPELLLETDHDGVVIGFHQSPPLTLALNPSEVIGQPPEGFLPAHVAQIARKAMAQVDADGWSETHGYSILINGVTKRFALYATNRGRLNATRAQGYLFIIRDVTESYRQTKHMSLLSRVAELSSNLIMLTDENRCVTWMNPAAVARTGVSLEASIGRRPSDIFRLEDAAANTMDEVRDKIDLFGQFRKEVPALNQTGLPYWIDLNIQPLRDAGGEIQGYMVVASDVSLHKLAESRALRERTHTMDLSDDAIAISQPDGHFTYMNPALRRIMNVPADARVESLTWYELNPPSVNERFFTIWPDLYAQGHWTGEIAFPQQGAPDRYFDLSIWVQDDGSFLSIARETTARKAVEKYNALLREQLHIAQSRQQIAQLAGGLAHDIFNLMAVIMHSADSLKPQIDPAEHESLDRMDYAIEQVLSLAKNMSKLGRRNSNRSVMDLRPIVKQATELLKPSLGGDAELTLSMPEKPINILCDRTEVMQALLNLLINARDALCIKTGTAQINVQIHLSEPSDQDFFVDVGTIASDESYVRVDICDTGCGLDEDLKINMFEPYFTTKGESGTGLGMSIVSGILLSNRAALRIESERGTGTCMQIFWPIASLTDTPKSDLVEEDQTPSLQGLNVLLLDNDEAGLVSLSRKLTRSGAEVASCDCLDDVIEALTDDPEIWKIIVANADTIDTSVKGLVDRLNNANLSVPIILTTSDKRLHFATTRAQNEKITVLQRPFATSVLVSLLNHAKLRTQN